MIIIKNADDTVQVITGGECLASEGSVVSYKRIFAKTLTIKGAHVIVDSLKVEEVKLIGDATLEASNITSRKNPFIDTSDASKYASVVINGVSLNLKKRSDSFNNPISKKRRPVHSVTADIDDRAFPVSDEVSEILEQFV